MDRSQEDFDLARLIENGVSQGDVQADVLAVKMEVSLEGAQKTRNVIGSFIRSYKNKVPELSNKLWLVKEFSNYPEIWFDEDELHQTAGDIVEQVTHYETVKEELANHHNKGLSTNN